MTHILDALDVIKNIEGMYDSNTSFGILKDFERVIDELDIYVYKNWMDGELAAGPIVTRHWVTASFFWPADKMPDPMGGKRLIDYDCKVTYRKSSIIRPRQIMKQDDVRSGTRKGKLDRDPIWIVEIRMPKSLLSEIYTANVEDEEELPAEMDMMPQEAVEPPAEGEVDPNLDQTAGGAV